MAATVQPAVVSANRALAHSLSATNWLGQNTPAIADIEAAYDQMWAMDVAAMYGYHADVDRAGHVYGLDSAQWRAAVAGVDRLVARLVERLPPDAALLVTADHGMVDVPPDHRVDADAHPGLRSGVEVIAGEPRVRYLHTVPGARADVMAAWRAVLGDRAWVASRDDVVAAGWFGPVAVGHLARIGDVVVACHGSHVVLASRTEPATVGRLVGYHGSYTSAEMRVPLIVVPGR